jgi:alcohol dehydrogenase (cytochrome c)
LATAGGLVFFGDVGGNFYAVDAASDQKLWGRKIGGAIGGGVITYAVNGAQKAPVSDGGVSTQKRVGWWAGLAGSPPR